MTPGREEEGEFRQHLDELRAHYANGWREAPSRRRPFGPPTSSVRHWSAALKGRSLIEEIGREIRSIPTDPEEQGEWRESLRGRIQSYGREHLGWPDGYRRLMLGDAFFDSALLFVDQARRFDGSMEPEHIGQALRNVWIGNSLQMMMGRTVEFRQGLFAYSMLYPVTDNWLDRCHVSGAAKAEFNERLGRRLAGERIEPLHGTERSAFELVRMIEDEFPRSQHPLVYSSLLAINSAQTLGLDLHGNETLDDERILDLSVRKGGASVMPDLYLIAPDAGPADRHFAFGYGVFLQLLDDFQDVEADLASGHETLFTRAAGRGPMDGIASKLSHFTESILDRESPLETDDDRIDVIRRNCRILYVNAMVNNKERLSAEFLGQAEREWPLTLKAQVTLMGHLERIFTDLCDEKSLSALIMSVPRR